MINFIITYDDINKSLGSYFQECHCDFHNFIIENHEIMSIYEEMGSNKTSMEYINTMTSKYNSKPFIYIAYTHGNQNEFVCNGIPYICARNTINFNNSFIYSTACYTGKKIAHNLLEDGCVTFVGYKDASHVFINENYRRISINCDNYALKMFLLMDVTIEDAVNSMKRYITSKIDKLEEFHEDPLYMASLVANREALVCLGNKALKKKDVYASKH